MTSIVSAGILKLTLLGPKFDRRSRRPLRSEEATTMIFDKDKLDPHRDPVPYYQLKQQKEFLG